MKFNLVDEISYERELVFATHRDKLLELIDYLPNVDDVQIDSREEDAGIVRLVNVWKGSSTDIPGPLRPVLKPELLTWADRATWDQNRWRVDWEITLSALPEAVTARGHNTFHDEGDDTVIQMNGEFVLHPDKVKGVPAFVAKRIAPTLERFVVGLLQPNLKQSNAAVERYLDDNV